MAAQFSSGAAGLAGLMVSAQTLEVLKAKGVLSQDDVLTILNKCLSDFRQSNTPASHEAGALLLQFYNAVPDVSLLAPKTEETPQ